MAIQTYVGFNYSSGGSYSSAGVAANGGRVFYTTRDIYITCFKLIGNEGISNEAPIYIWDKNSRELIAKTNLVQAAYNEWKTIFLSTPIRLVKNKEYIISYFSSKPHISRNGYQMGPNLNATYSYITFLGMQTGGGNGSFPTTFCERSRYFDSDNVVPFILDFEYQTFDYKYLLRDMRVGVKTLNSNIQQINNLHIDPVLKAVSKSKDFTSTSFYFPISKGIEYDFTIKNSANLNIAGTLDKNPADLTEAESRSLMRLIDNKTLPNGYLPYTLNFKQQEGENYFLAQVSDEENTPEVNLIGTAPYVLYNYDEEGNLQELDEQNITTNTFITYGFDEPPTAEDLVKLGHPSVMYWQEYNVNPQFTATVEALPPSQTVISDKIDLTNETILGIDSMTVDCEGGLLLAVSFDDKKTWKVWTGDAWATTENEFTGMTKDMVESITYDQWNELYQGATGFYIRVAFINPSQSVRQVYVRFLGN